MSFYDEMAGIADDLLREYGAPAVLTRVTPGGYDPTTSTTTSPVTNTWTGVGAKFDYDQHELADSRIRDGDQRVYLSVLGLVNPQTGDTLTIGSAVLDIVTSRALRPAATDVLFDVQVRGLI